MTKAQLYTIRISVQMKFIITFLSPQGRYFNHAFLRYVSHFCSSVIRRTLVVCGRPPSGGRKNLDIIFSYN
jgi:hypothetical protein